MASVTLEQPVGTPPQPLPLRLRTDLKIVADEDGGFVLEDPASGQFFRVGPAEYGIISRLDGQKTLAEAAREAAMHCRGLPPPVEMLAALSQWLINTGLVDIPGTAQSHARPNPARSAGGFDPCYFRIPLGGPDRWLRPITRYSGWIFSRPAVGAVVVLSLIALVHLAQQWRTFASSLSGILCPDQHLAILGCWLTLKLLHEMGHGIACQRLGGTVRQWGLAMIFLAPVAYTDVTSSWSFGSRRERMAVAAAGIYVEWLAALAAIALWSWTSNPTVRQLCAYVISLATIASIGFNANPLCRLDGYYILSDWLGWPNLAADGQRISRSWLRRLAGGPVEPPAGLPAGRYVLLGLYGLAAGVWRVLAIASVAALVSLSYEGFGALAIAAVALLWWSRSQVRKAAGAPRSDGFPIRRLALQASAAVTVVIALCFLPWPGAATAPGVVEHQQRHVVHAAAPGLVGELFVSDGQWVAAGEKLAQLENADLVLELADLECACQQTAHKIRSLRTKRKLVELQIEEHRQAQLVEQRAQLQHRLDELTLRAPIAGRVVARRLADRRGAYLAEGEELCAIVEESREFQIAIAQADIPAFAASVGHKIEVVLPGQRLSGVLSRLEPRATSTLHHSVLGAQAGGPLPVVPQTDAAVPPGDAWQLSEPRVVGHIHFPMGDDQLLAGQRGYAHLRPLNETLAHRLTRALGAWLHDIRQRNG